MERALLYSSMGYLIYAMSQRGIEYDYAVINASCPGSEPPLEFQWQNFRWYGSATYSTQMHTFDGILVLYETRDANARLTISVDGEATSIEPCLTECKKLIKCREGLHQIDIVAETTGYGSVYLMPVVTGRRTVRLNLDFDDSCINIEQVPDFVVFKKSASVRIDVIPGFGSGNIRIGDAIIKPRADYRTIYYVPVPLNESVEVHYNGTLTFALDWLVGGIYNKKYNNGLLFIKYEPYSEYSMSTLPGWLSTYEEPLRTFIYAFNLPFKLPYLSML